MSELFRNPIRWTKRLPLQTPLAQNGRSGDAEQSEFELQLARM